MIRKGLAILFTIYMVLKQGNFKIPVIEYLNVLVWIKQSLENIYIPLNLPAYLYWFGCNYGDSMY